MEKNLKVSVAIRDKELEDKVIDIVKSHKWQHSFVNVDDVTCKEHAQSIVFVVGEGYYSILNLIEMHNSCELNFHPTIVVCSDSTTSEEHLKTVKYPEKYFFIGKESLESLATQIIKTMDSLRDAYKLKKIYQFREEVLEAFRKEKVFSKFIKKVFPSLLNLLYADTGSIMLLNEKNNLVIEATTKKHLEDIEVEYNPKSVAWTVMDTKKPVVVEDIESDSRFKKGEGYLKNYFISIPIFIGEEIKGVLNLTDKATPMLFDFYDNDNANKLIKVLEPYISMKYGIKS
ncbi:MAG: GAF domain-containing protein [bacterium]